LTETTTKNQKKGQQKLGRAWSAGVNIDTGKVAVACSGGGYCAEGNVVNALGGDSSRVAFTKSREVTKRDPFAWKEKPVCAKCEEDYIREQFPPGTRFESDEQ
jgi:hypothetical protein